MEKEYLVFGLIIILFLAMLPRGWEMRTRSKSKASSITMAFAVIVLIFVLLYVTGNGPDISAIAQ